MKIQTKYHGEMTVEESTFFTFNNGLPGFIDEKKYIIIPFSEDTPFFILQSVSTANVAFVMIEPFTYFNEYDFQLDDHIVEQLQLTSEKDVAVYNIITVQEPFDKTTINLQAPIVINANKRLGKQIILTNTPYHTKHALFENKAQSVK
ncbi:flagellar assembly protein FliW [Cytobacillus sp. IB215665]|uniref:flagellar assembly protein FliW n=1 Tax=Cytobacillus sp. IB215665 TaxID=3097357 RepID=UPI002A14CC16|nr:flagellar assembly protein FliW [Cytobacillus sp. IB215665]MDX8363823.1 flagellar assembly protein FliW [Cytobacillus sp. IB215665]